MNILSSKCSIYHTVYSLDFSRAERGCQEGHFLDIPRPQPFAQIIQLLHANRGQLTRVSSPLSPHNAYRQRQIQRLFIGHIEPWLSIEWIETDNTKTLHRKSTLLHYIGSKVNNVIKLEMKFCWGVTGRLYQHKSQS